MSNSPEQVQTTTAETETTGTPPPIEPPIGSPTSLLSDDVEPAGLTDEDPSDPPPEEDTPPAPEPITAESLTFPEGVTLDNELLDGALSLFNNADIRPTERMQQLLDLQIEASTKAADAANAAGQALWNETQTTWQEEVAALPKLGGENLDKTLATIKAGLKQVGATKETFAAIDLTGAGNNPEIVKILHALTAPLSEGGPQSGNPTGGPISKADKLFGTK